MRTGTKRKFRLPLPAFWLLLLAPLIVLLLAGSGLSIHHARAIMAESSQAYGQYSASLGHPDTESEGAHVSETMGEQLRRNVISAQDEENGMLLSLIATLAYLGFASWLVQNQLVRPLEKIRAYVDALGTGVPAEPQPTSRIRVVDDLAETLANLSEYLGRATIRSEKIETERSQFRRMSLHDAMTGLYNRRAFDTLLQRTWDATRDEGAPIGVIMMDVDKFKAYNDTLGHQAGDDCLRKVAEAVARSIRSEDMAARYGGEEFAVILPGADAPRSLAAAERIRAAVEAQELPHPESPAGPYVTVSLGVAAESVSGDGSPENLLRKADTALYYSKKHGRNRSTAFSASCRNKEQGDEPRNGQGTPTAMHADECACNACRDRLTGTLLARGFFAKAQSLMSSNPDTSYCLLRFAAEGVARANVLKGLDAGDHLLKLIARLTRLRLNPKMETLARMEGAGFAIFLAGGPERALRFARHLTRLMDDPGKQRRAGLYFGICEARGKDLPAHALYDCAGLALRTVRGSEVRNIAMYDDTLRKKHEDEAYITRNMANALAQGQFKLFLQPKVQISTGRVVGAEALTRWMHPNDGCIMPDRFVPLFESNGFVVKLDEYIWEQTCRFLRACLDKGYPALRISVNVSRMNFSISNLAARLVKLTDTYSIPHELLELEITETAFVSQKASLPFQMQSLRAAGFSLSMDDFGVGYSSLNTLRDLPFTTVKLDKDFVQGETANARGRIVAQSTIAMAHALGLSIVAEGVETVDQALFLLANGCYCAQGFYYSRPLAADIFEERFLAQKQTFDGIHIPNSTDVAMDSPHAFSAAHEGSAA